MLVLFETPAGYAIFKLLDESKLKKVDNIWDEFSSSTKSQENLQLVAFKHFKDVEEAITNITSVGEGKLSKTLKKVLKSKTSEAEELAVGDVKLGNLIKEKLSIQCVNNSAVSELMRSIRANIDTLLSEQKAEITAMRLALAHSLGRYKVKFNPEKIDTMIVQAVSLLDDLDKELNNYVMRCREWYGWHFPELSKLIQDSQAYAKVVKAIGMKQNAVKVDLSEILPEDLAARVKEEAEMSMGTDISELDLIHITQLCDQIIEITGYRSELHEYLKNRMYALAPNLTVLLGELVGARLISKAGSLVVLPNQKDTPKYGIIYHAQLISQTATKLKGKVARKLAAKVSLATRIDALSEDNISKTAGIESRAYIEGVIKNEQERGPKRFSGVQKAPAASYTYKKEVFEYDASADYKMQHKGKKRMIEEVEQNSEGVKKMKVEETVEETLVTELEEPPKKKEKKAKKAKREEEAEEEE
uniref:Nop domain-containing protein n=1 Tax=Ditylenchus dipsaci TaxID=166011 RepID=A0A915E556_9BILA